MKALHGTVAYCVREKKACVGWVEKYFGDCLCNLNDDLSFVFGLISLVCWGVAEIPQIVTNFRSKSSHGVSLLFLLTWIAGDIFNLVGCLLESATLPTQYYTALLYTASTVVLVLQSLYYDYVYPWWKSQKMEHNQKEDDEEKKPLRPTKPADSGIPIPVGAQATTTPHREYYYASARSMASGSTPPTWSYLRAARSGPSVMAGLDQDNSSSEDEHPLQSSSKKSRSKPQPIPRSAGNGATMLATSLSLLPGSHALMQAYGRLSTRKLLQEQGTGSNAYGQWLGWMMAAIYMGGRIPQIWLNITRGSVEGLNPLMFMFALIANATYVGSILVRTTEWDKIKANLPWLLDAAVCVGLDLFIILQYIYYRYFRRRNAGGEQDYGGCHMEANKPLLS